MNFKEQYTSPTLIEADKEGVEIKKTPLSNDAYAIGDMLEKVINGLERIRSSLNG